MNSDISKKGQTEREFSGIGIADTEEVVEKWDIGGYNVRRQRRDASVPCDLPLLKMIATCRLAPCP